VIQVDEKKIFPKGSLAELVQETVRDVRAAAEQNGVSLKKITISAKIFSGRLESAYVFTQNTIGQDPIFPAVEICLEQEARI
jgi:hypothetical protein